jgi:hypothetical protein
MKMNSTPERNKYESVYNKVLEQYPELDRNRPKNNSRGFYFRANEEVLNKLDLIAKEFKISKAQVIRELIEEC